jgi:hypothetical protein
VGVGFLFLSVEADVAVLSKRQRCPTDKCRIYGMAIFIKLKQNFGGIQVKGNIFYHVNL